MDGASVVRLIAAVIELANVTKAVVKRVKSFHSQTTEVPEALRLLHHRLPLLASILLDIEDQLKSDQLAPPKLAALENITGSCQEELGNLQSHLQRLLPAPDDSSPVKLKKAIQSLRSDSKIRRSANRLKQYLFDLNCYQGVRASLKSDQILALSAKTVSRVIPSSILCWTRA